LLAAVGCSPRGGVPAHAYPSTDPGPRGFARGRLTRIASYPSWSGGARGARREHVNTAAKIPSPAACKSLASKEGLTLRQSCPPLPPLSPPGCTAGRGAGAPTPAAWLCPGPAGRTVLGARWVPGLLHGPQPLHPQRWGPAPGCPRGMDGLERSPSQACCLLEGCSSQQHAAAPANFLSSPCANGVSGAPASNCF